MLSQVLLSLPCIAPQDLLAFEEALAKTSSPKEQKQHMRSLLLLATGNKLKALANPKSVGVITNVSGQYQHLIYFSSTNNIYECFCPFFVYGVLPIILKLKCLLFVLSILLWRFDCVSYICWL